MVTMVASWAQNSLAQLLALGSEDVAVVTLADIPASVGITGRGAAPEPTGRD